VARAIRSSDRLRSVLIVDDDAALVAAMSREFRSLGFEVRSAPTSGQALAELLLSSVDLVLLDVHLESGATLEELLPEIRQLQPEARVLVMSGFGTIPVAVDAMRRGAVHFLSKPVRASDVLQALGGAPRNPPPLPSLARVEWEYLQRVLHASGGNVSLAARQLGIHRRSLQRKLQRRPPR
jgi:two-component system response regulator RegA